MWHCAISSRFSPNHSDSASYVTLRHIFAGLQKKNPTSVCIITSDECPPKTNKKRLQKLTPKLCNVDTNYLVVLFLKRFLNIGSLTGPLFPIGIENLIYMFFFVTVRQMGIKGILISAALRLINHERSRNMPTSLQH